MNQSDINSRVVQVIKQSGLNNVVFAQLIGATRQSVANWKQGTHNVPFKFVVKIIEEFQELDARWLLTGKLSGISPEAEKQLDDIAEYDQLVERNKHLQERLEELTSELLSEKDQRIELMEKALQKK